MGSDAIKPSHSPLRPERNLCSHPRHPIPQPRRGGIFRSCRSLKPCLILAATNMPRLTALKMKSTSIRFNREPREIRENKNPNSRSRIWRISRFTFRRHNSFRVVFILRAQARAERPQVGGEQRIACGRCGRVIRSHGPACGRGRPARPSYGRACGRHPRACQPRGQAITDVPLTSARPSLHRS